MQTVRVRRILVALAVLLAAAGAQAAKNVIVMVPDGCSASLQTLARWYKGAPLAVDALLTGNVTTYMANSVVTDSAPAATAFATGQKSTDKFIGVGPRAEDVLSGFPVPPESLRYKPLATVLEGARLKGKATGVVATSNITHATPAGFVAHVHDRGLANEIMEQLVYQNVDVVLGGGRVNLLPTSAGGKRTDGEDLLALVKARGYVVVEKKSELASVSSGRVFGMLADNHMQPHIDRVELAPEEPSLAEITAKAIEILAKDPDGFFLMVEGSQVDWAMHANDPIWAVTDFLAFDDAVKVALDFAVADGDTLLVAFPDHDTGGISIGNYRTSNTYTRMTIEDVVNPLKGMKITAEAVAGKIGADPTADKVKTAVSEWWGLTLSDDDASAILAEAQAVGLGYALGKVVSARHTVIGWSTHGHTGTDVPLWSHGPGAPRGLVDNTDLARVVAAALGFDLAAVDQHLFVDLKEVFPSTSIDLSDPTNPVVRIGSSSLAASKNTLHYGALGLTFPLDGLVVYAPKTGKAYASRLAVAILNALQQVAVPFDARRLDAFLEAEEITQVLGFPIAPEAIR